MEVIYKNCTLTELIDLLQDRFSKDELGEIEVSVNSCKTFKIEEFMDFSIGQFNINIIGIE